ncbi:MAG: cyclic nucleotide-binding domain-containing protein [Anaerolineae bacterium]|nr:cyclic nucleotide-binding domain-containing protein [Anaerolineae bacterium]
MQQIERDEALAELRSLLDDHPAFANLSPEQLDSLSQRCTIKFCWQGTYLVEKNEENPDKFYMVIRGEFSAIDTDKKPPQLLNYMDIGSIFGIRSLLNNAPRSATVEAMRDSVVAVFTRETLEWLLSQDHGIEDYFRTIERRYDDAAVSHFPGKQPDEVVIVAAKRHFLAFISKLTGPVLILIIPVVILIIGEVVGLSIFNMATSGILLLLTLPFVIVSALMLLYYYVDWRNDDFIVTTKRVVHIERILFYGEERREAPLTQIQSVTVQSHNWLDLFFDVDDIHIKTAAVGTVSVDNLPSAQYLSRIILQQQQRAKDRVAFSDTRALRDMLKQRLEKSILDEKQKEGADPKFVKRRVIPPVRVPKLNLDYFVPRIRVISSNNQEITWRKHYFILFSNLLLPFPTLLISIALLVLGIFGMWPFSSSVSWLWITILVVGVLLSFFWYLWEYDDWRRDVYKVTPTKIIDVQSSPFRLKGENVREGSFDSIQSITYNIPNFFYKVLNLGDVIIKTASQQGDFTFTKVFNPSSVQEEVFRRWDTFQQKKREKTRDDTNKQVVEIVGEYHEISNPPAANEIHPF